MRIFTGRLGIALAALLAGAICQPALAEDRVVKVGGNAQPWSVAVNPDRDFGLNDGAAPVMVWSLRLVPGTMLHFEATGGTRTVLAGGQVGPDGYPGEVYNDRPGNTGRVMPSRYFDKATYPEFPANVNALVGSFVDGDGRVVGTPFLIGRERSVEVPEGAMAVSLGINDDRFSDNDGFLTVVVKAQVGSVIVEKGAAQ